MIPVENHTGIICKNIAPRLNNNPDESESVIVAFDASFDKTIPFDAPVLPEEYTIITGVSF